MEKMGSIGGSVCCWGKSTRSGWSFHFLFVCAFLNELMSEVKRD